jgi:hypothetical protein
MGRFTGLLIIELALPFIASTKIVSPEEVV